MRTIALEEHYATPAFMDGPGRQIKEEAAAARAHPRVAAGLARPIHILLSYDEEPTCLGVADTIARTPIRSR